MSTSGSDRTKGDVYCWGNNDKGQLGDGTTAPSLVPKRVVFAGDSRVLRFVIGDDLGCALLQPGDMVWCWGKNDVGQAGQDPTRMPTVMRPTLVSALPPVNGIFPGTRHVCARHAASREPWCWGANDRGQLGLGTASAWERPTQVPGVPAIDTMRAGVDFTCALLASPGLEVRGRCWGSNSDQQLGDGTGRSSAIPVQVRQ